MWKVLFFPPGGVQPLAYAHVELEYYSATLEISYPLMPFVPCMMIKELFI